MIQKLKQKLSLLSRKSVTRQIQGQPWTFSPVSLSLFYELKTSLEPMWLAVQNLMKARDSSSDGKRVIQQETRPDKTTETVTIMEPPSIEMVKFRQDRADASVKEALNTLLGDASRLSLARIMADSLREEGGRMSDDEAVEFFNAIDMPTAFEFLGGFIEANAAVFGPLVQRAVSAIKERLAPVMKDEASEGSKGPQGLVPGEAQS